MPRNAHFQFKQFRIEQNQCAMKVCTDACVFGAWADYAGAARILDIGTGTGLLALMAAQRNLLARIDAVEIDAEAADQARENVRNSPFTHRIQVYHAAVQDFAPAYRYDSIIVNPPFFQRDLRSPDASVNRAHHAVTLDFSALLTALARLLDEDGRWHVLLPPAESDVLAELAAANGWTLDRELILSHADHHVPFRVMRTFSRKKTDEKTLLSETLSIYESASKTYTLAFRQLLQEFYLNF